MTTPNAIALVSPARRLFLFETTAATLSGAAIALLAGVSFYIRVTVLRPGFSFAPTPVKGRLDGDAGEPLAIRRQQLHRPVE
jgi:hypothetical protein